MCPFKRFIQRSICNQNAFEVLFYTLLTSGIVSYYEAALFWKSASTFFRHTLYIDFFLYVFAKSKPSHH